MGENSNISWTDDTFNPWIGCSKVHAGCTNCYVESYAKRYGKANWGVGGTRVLTSDANWRKPVKWNREAETSGVRRKVFCASLADVFEEWKGTILNSQGEPLFDCGDGNWRPAAEINRRAFPGFDPEDRDFLVTLNDVRNRLFRLWRATPWLDWQVLTKRPENIRRMFINFILEKVIGRVSQNAGDGWHLNPLPNVWFGTSISDQETADKAVPELLKCRDLTPVLFLSAEPLLKPLSLHDADRWIEHLPPAFHFHWLEQPFGIDWVIVGGESGGNRRDCGSEAIVNLTEQCAEAETPVFVKQDCAFTSGEQGRLSNEVFALKQFPRAIAKATT